MNEKLKAIATDCLAMAQEEFNSRSYLMPTLHVVSGEKVRKIQMVLEDESDKEFLTKMMSNIAEDVNVDALMFIIDSYTLTVPNELVDKVEAELTSIKDHKNAQDALLTVVHSREGSYSIASRYRKTPEGYIFFDTGLEEGPVSGEFSNPFIE